MLLLPFAPLPLRPSFYLYYTLPFARTIFADTRKILGDASEAALLLYVDGLNPIHEFKLAVRSRYFA